ncbi:hypothetical protein JG687_00005713 [Phytophthora cactorum]|uniref:Uncharacterized protein n=1 Tax=Phytophthora cactorum TaxID=29920 RepID=A0A8T1UPM3_9STRA|nr:hypothetical protein JG687_00005713 [Phytophthora cactorum]
MHCPHASLYRSRRNDQDKAKRSSDELPSWARNVENESAATIPEHEEDEPLSNARTGMERLCECAIDNIDEYLDEKISSLRRSELDAVRVMVQHSRTLAVYF